MVAKNAGGDCVDSKLKQVISRIENGEIRSAHIYELIDIYYQCVIYKNDEYEDDADLPDDTQFPEELTLPLSNRKSGIIEALSLLISQGYDVHDSNDYFNALMLAVGYADEPMTAFLIANGADVHTWPNMDELPEEWTRNYYLEDIDVKYFHSYFEHNEEYKSALLRTAKTLAKASGIKGFGGLCLLVDETGNVFLAPPKMKF